MKLQTLIVSFVSLLLLNVTLAVAGSVPEVIQFDGAVDGGRTDALHASTYTGPVTFQHQKHFAEYGAQCGDCHHDENRDPIDGYSADNSFNCIDCHDEPGMIRGPIAENAATHDDIVARRANVIHILCIGCHKEHNAKDHVVRAPESCRICHEKKPQGWSIE